MFAGNSSQLTYHNGDQSYASYMYMQTVLGRSCRKQSDTSFHQKIGGERLGCSQQDNLPPHVCNKCTSRVSALEKATADLAAFKRSARSVMQEAHQSLKRTKETTGSFGVSPDTLRCRPRSKMARRLDFTSMFLKMV